MNTVSPSPFDGPLANGCYGLIGLGITLILLGIAVRNQSTIRPKSGCTVLGIIVLTIGMMLLATLVGADARNTHMTIVIDGALVLAAIVAIVATITAGSNKLLHTVR